MNLGLSGKVVMITGASRGIGRACALLLAEEGAHLALGARHADDLAQVAKDARVLGVQVVTEASDMVKQDNVDRLAERAVGELGGLHGLVSCVGSTPLGDFDALDDALWQAAFEMKFLASVRALRATTRHFRSAGSGSAVVVAGNSTHVPDPLMATSSVINGALVRMVGAFARQVAGVGISVNCVSPGPVTTQRFDGLVEAHAAASGLDTKAARLQVQGQIPRGRAARPDEVAVVVVSLLSPLFSHVNGENVLVDGAQGWPR